MKKLTAIVVGFGARGARYAEYSLDHPDELEIVAVADALPRKLESAKKRHNLPDNMLFTDWKDLAALPKMADFAIVSTQDNMHYEPAMALIEQGYDLLLEKPIAPTAWECKNIKEAAEKKGVQVVVCHLMRNTPYWTYIYDLLEEGVVGEIKTIIHSENVGNEHYAHSYVRGAWRNTAESSFMLLAKSCHDMDLMQWIIGKQCKRVQSFGSLTHFNKANQPEGAPDRCVDGCPYYESCLYSVKRQYIDHEPMHYFRRIACNTVEKTTDEQLLEAMKTGPYGRCVYACDNDVVDHQVVNMEFEDGTTVSFTMHAFSEHGRYTRIYGTKAQLVADEERNTVTVFPFDTREHINYELPKVDHSINAGHGGGDQGIMRDTLRFFRDGDPQKNVPSIQTSYMNHVITFAAEESRLTGRIIELDQFEKEI